MSSLGKQSIKFYVIRSILRRLTRHTTTKKLTTQAPQQEKLWYARIKDYVWMVTFGIAVASGLTLMLKGGRNSGSVIRPLYTVSENSNANNNYNFLRKVVERSAPAVVYVEIIQNPEKSESHQPLVLSNGSGFIINENGLVLTNAHVVVNKPKAMVSVVTTAGDRYKAEVLDVDMNIDLALLRIKPFRNMRALKLEDSSEVKMGEWVVALGSPLSLTHSATAGIVSAVSRSANELGLKNHSMRYIQTDASITFGNSGGPLLNLNGNVIGVNNLRVTAGISFAIPVEFVKRFLESSHINRRDSGETSLKNLGLTTISFTPELAERVDAPDTPQGILVWKVINGAAAQRSGLEVGDVISHINGIPATDPKEVYQKTPLKLTVSRKGKSKDFTVNNLRL